MLKKIWEWLVKSSENSQELSLTVKSFLLGLIPVIISLAGVANIKVESQTLTMIIDVIANVIIYVGGIVTATATIIGLVRKIVYTIAGKNDVVASWKNR